MKLNFTLLFILIFSVSFYSCRKCNYVEPAERFILINYIDSSDNVIYGENLKYSPNEVKVIIGIDTLQQSSHWNLPGLMIYYDEILNLNQPILIQLDSIDMDTLNFKCVVIPRQRNACFHSYSVTECNYNSVNFENPEQIIITK